MNNSDNIRALANGIIAALVECESKGIGAYRDLISQWSSIRRKSFRWRTRMLDVIKFANDTLEYILHEEENI